MISTSGETSGRGYYLTRTPFFPYRFAQVLSLAFTLALVLGNTGCAGTSWRRSGTILSEPLLIVEREERMQRGEPVSMALGHPASMSSAMIAGVLANLSYRGTGMFRSSELAPVIEPGLVPPLAHAIAEGLAQCQPSERVRFLARNAQLSLGFIPTERHARGVAFVDPPGTLNLAFDRVGAAPDSDDPREATSWQDPTWNRYTSVAMELPEGVRLYRDDQGRERPLWILVDLAQASRQDGAQVTHSERPPALLRPTPDTATPTPEPSAAGPPGTTPPLEEAPSTATLTDPERLARLRYLEELRANGAISAEEYERQKRALLFPR